MKRSFKTSNVAAQATQTPAKAAETPASFRSFRSEPQLPQLPHTHDGATCHDSTVNERHATMNATEPTVATETPSRPAAELWTDEQACQFLSAESRTLRHWRHTRGLPFIRITSKVLRYRRADLARWLDARRVQIRGAR